MLHFPATEGNRDPIWDVLSRHLPASGRILEVASGSGQHVAHFAARSPQLVWIPSDPEPAHRDSIRAWCAELPNVEEPLDLDVRNWPAVDPLAAILAINLIHISPWDSTLGLLAGAARSLELGGFLYFYGAFIRAGHATAPSNLAFDRGLRGQNPAWGVRELEAVETRARALGFGPAEVTEMPVNNLSVMFRLSGIRRGVGPRLPAIPDASA